MHRTFLAYLGHGGRPTMMEHAIGCSSWDCPHASAMGLALQQLRWCHRREMDLSWNPARACLMRTVRSTPGDPCHEAVHGFVSILFFTHQCCSPNPVPMAAGSSRVLLQGLLGCESQQPAHVHGRSCTGRLCIGLCTLVGV
ncbi:hypothetical protein WJX74_001667 [Apatococcus lobatus]|uniref:Uncharacterized protein n=1 Tax=Apatococcus lobatus TaxID=904363 RepID=A0AAW1RZ40_9CHLO